MTVFAKGPEDPHFLDAKPGFIKALSQADLLIEAGLDLESGWLPVLMKNRETGGSSPALRSPQRAKAIVPLDVPTGQVDRSMGDVHAGGNPHYLLDPLNGLLVARLIKDKFSELRPREARLFADRYASYRMRVGTALVGDRLAAKYEFEKLAILYQHGRLDVFLREQGEESHLGGWLASMLPFRGTKVVGDHNLWPYFAARFGLLVIGFLEPKPGIPPTTKHLGEIISSMQKENARIILKSPYSTPNPPSLSPIKPVAAWSAWCTRAEPRRGPEVTWRWSITTSGRWWKH